MAEAVSYRLSSYPAEMLLMLLPSVIIIALFLIIWFKVAKNFAAIAADKGYSERK